MEEKFLYFQPEYVDRFKCDGSKCHAICCKGWQISVDKATYEKYSRIQPKDEAEEILSHLKLNSDRDAYLVTLDEKKFCPFLTEENLCRLQKEHGKDFLSVACTVYPRRIWFLGDFFERSLTLTCPVAAEMILFSQEPLQFRFVKVSEKVHGKNGKIHTNSIKVNKILYDEIFGIQGIMIMILQERRLSINQRLIVLSFLTDDVEKLLAAEISLAEDMVNLIRNLKKLVAAYNPKTFLQGGVPSAIQSIPFSAKKFIMLMLIIFSPIYAEAYKNFSANARKYFDAVIDILKITPAENRRVSVEEVADNYEKLADARKIFSEKYATFLENYLVNELFLTLCPWGFRGSITQNFLVFVATYKVFELIIFSATLKGFSSKADLLAMVNWFASEIDHSDALKEKILKLIEDQKDFFAQPESLLEQ